MWKWIITEVGVIQDTCARHSEHLCFRILEKRRKHQQCVDPPLGKEDTQMGMSLEPFEAKHNHNITEIEQCRDWAQGHLFAIIAPPVFMKSSNA